MKDLTLIEAIIFFGVGAFVLNILMGRHKFLERKTRRVSYKLDDQNVGSHKTITDSVFILFKKTDFNTILNLRESLLVVVEVMRVGVLEFLSPN